MWSKHCRNESGVLTLYGKAMFQLATEVWPHQHHVTRIDWCVSACREYFYGTGLQRIREKELRRQAHLNSSESEATHDSLGFGKYSPSIADRTKQAAALVRSSAVCDRVFASGTVGEQNHTPLSELGVSDVHKV